MTSEPTQGGQPGADPAATPQKPSPGPVAPPARRVRRTRAGGAWVVAACFALILILLLIFILENNQSVEISYFGAHGHMPLGVALLFAAMLGIILLAIPVTWRIIQLRRANRRQRHLAAKAG